jgi:histidinol dehydrogenase
MTSGNPAALRARPMRLDTRAPGFEAEFKARLQVSASEQERIYGQVAEIIDQVRQRGDAAVLEYTARWDRVLAASMRELEIGQAELARALGAVTAAQRNALVAAAERVRSFHEEQKRATGGTWSYRDAQGNRLGQKIGPLDRVGIYVPGGKAAYPSSVLMNAIPARVAGVGEIIMAVPTPGGERNAMVLAAASLAGVDRVFAVGGAQAVAALAWGTETIPAVDKITGPGRDYVAEAKRQVFGKVGIDMIAGPSEILVLADGSTPAEWVAMDLFSQAEHDELAQSILLCPDAAYLDAVQAAIDRLLPQMPRATIIAASLNGRGALVLTRDMHEACTLCNQVAPEHLELSCLDPQRWEPLLRHAGAIFLGAFTSESLGDYCAGPNHVLPTSGSARFSSPLGVYDFQKRGSLVEVSHEGAQALGAIAEELALGEGLQAHARAARLRMDAPRPVPAEAPDTCIEDLVREFIRQDIQGTHAYAVQASEGLVKLDAMENPYPLPAELQLELGRRLGALPVNRYPARQVESLKQALARHVGLPDGHALMLGNGSDELIALLAMACDRPGASLLAPEPGFVMYAMSARQQGLRYVGVPLTADFELDRPAMLEAIRRQRPAIVYLAYPNNPTAGLWDANAMREIIAQAPGLVVLDEAYQPFSSRSWIDEIRADPAANRKVLLMRTLSKFGLAGVRIGYMLGARALIEQVDKLRPPYNVSVLNAECGLFALQHAQLFERQAGEIRQQRSRLCAAFQGLPGVRVFPSDANMILIRVPDAAALFERLKQRGLLVKNVSALHPLLANCLRVTVGTPSENDQLIKAMEVSL